MNLRSFYVPNSITSSHGINLNRNGLNTVLLHSRAGYFTFLTNRRSFTTTRNTVNLTEDTGGTHGRPLHIILGNLNGSTTGVVSEVGNFACIRARFSCCANRLAVIRRATCSGNRHTGIHYCNTSSIHRNITVVRGRNISISVANGSAGPAHFRRPITNACGGRYVRRNGGCFSITSNNNAKHALRPSGVTTNPTSCNVASAVKHVRSSTRFTNSSSIPTRIRVVKLVNTNGGPVINVAITYTITMGRTLGGWYMVGRWGIKRVVLRTSLVVYPCFLYGGRGWFSV